MRLHLVNPTFTPELNILFPKTHALFLSVHFVNDSQSQSEAQPLTLVGIRSLSMSTFLSGSATTIATKARLSPDGFIATVTLLHSAKESCASVWFPCVVLPKRFPKRPCRPRFSRKKADTFFCFLTKQKGNQTSQNHTSTWENFC